MHPAIHLIRCFNVAAITALGVWHGYAFQLKHQSGPQQQQQQQQVIELPADLPVNSVVVIGTRP
jgi:hypothetical protein